MTKKEQPTGRFNDLGIGKKFLEILLKKGFKIPTPIQHQVIPGALQGKDVVGIAQTGTGKTLAFGIPMIQSIASNKGQGLVLVPTRELALQVEQDLRNVGQPLGLKTAVIIGGAPQYSQKQALKRNPHIIIATPGRLVDLMNQGACKLDKITIITLDEADRMLDIGFLKEIKRVLQTIPKNHQTMLFSATMPKTISNLASQFMKLPLRIEIAPQGTSAENIEHQLFVVNQADKMRLLDSILQQYSEDKMLIFSRTKHGAKRIAANIRKMGFTATEIHSNRSQSQRKLALDGFKSNRFRVLVATDIASRGIDVKDISLVINYDLPENSEDYVHRIGRTGRAGKSGKAISFVASSQKYEVQKIENLIQKYIPVAKLPELPPQREGIQNNDDQSPRPWNRGQSNRSRRRPWQGSSRNNRSSNRRRRNNSRQR